jgi:Domain of unknown function (DUF3458_C) ARM repeats
MGFGVFFATPPWTRYSILSGKFYIGNFFCSTFLKVFDLSVQEFISKALTLPGEGEIMDMMQVADPDAVHAVRTFIRKELALQLKQEFLAAVSLSFLYASYFHPI